MNESTLRDFFSGDASLQELVADLHGAITDDGHGVRRHAIVDMDTEFVVLSSHLARICDAFLAGSLNHDDLRAIGFCIVASDNFDYDTDCDDGARVADVAIDWSTPEINFPIDSDHVAKWKLYLETGADTLRHRDA
ncbi:hypothetical protein CA13_31180 [Planctomycetes bacterium CA13]|uniref:Uncharacterized protein n=1 Tax=Novipirellula herctigrandis TaxID=2527986 RepID=A0A5C5Z398_9BACT|nr:hypothetical protein CA13_31180 [Planctomycetes bacterium CA13]